MAAGDRNVLAFANRNSLQYKQARAYGAGAVCIKDGLFYETNDNIPEDTAFVEGTTGQTWKLVGSKPIEDWKAATEYEVGDQVFAVGSLWECKTAHTSTTTFADTNWTLKAGIVNELKWSVDATGNIIPDTKDTQSIGSETKHLFATHVQGVNFYAPDGSYMGNIDADDNNLGIYSGDDNNATNELRFGIKNNVSDFKIQPAQILVEKKLKVEADLVTTKNITIEAKDGNKGGRLETASDGAKLITDGTNLYLGSNGGSDWFISGGGDLRPMGDNVRALGGTSNRISTIYAKNGTINTSDEREKYFEVFPDELLEVWLDYVKPKTYKWKASVDSKGNQARSRFGVSAQDVVKAFLAADLDWTKYAVVYPDFHDVETGSNIIPEDFDYKDIDNLPRLMISYDQVQVIEMAAIRHKLGL